MSTLYYIPDEQLPLNQDFKSLRKEGLDYIQAYGSTEWTNLNPSDPGVTILDQLCYALTELGYCNDFSVADILTMPNGKLRIKDQFYLPEEILTTSPVTIQDYRKYIIDAVKGVTNAIILPVMNNTVTGIYKVCLLTGQSTNNKTIPAATYVCLNKCRNLGEIFLEPSFLEQINYLITGSIEIESGKDLNKILLQVQNKIQNYILPQVLQTGYGQLIEKGTGVNEIFNGPLLQNGWILTDALGEKKDRLRAIELAQVIESVQGISSASIVTFFKSKEEPALSNAISGKSQILTVDVINSVQQGYLEIYYKGRKLLYNSNPKLNSLQPEPEPGSNILLGASVDIQTQLPEGKFRDIHSYYSIQNTFPEIFAVGADAIVSNATDFQIAQSRQLKGYLTLFDQVLANQFSQLANIDRLFSFKNSMKDAPSDKVSIYEVKDECKERHSEYPAPYLVFSPTYFYQALYDVPHIRPLLKDYGIFEFSNSVMSDKELEKNSWIEYKQDPYNPYIRGLMDLIEEDCISLTRRNDILDHLLARHGESPLVINSLIDGSIYSGDRLKDQVIFKSLYLQNFGLLSYFRQKAYNSIGANKLSHKLPEISKNLDQQILGGDSIDFIFNSGMIDRIEKLAEKDFINYSALELKLSLLFGLKIQYRDYIANNYDEKILNDNLQYALWMILQRKGVILIESGLLQQYADFLIVLTENPGSGPYLYINKGLNPQPGSKKLNYKEAMAISYSFCNDDQNDLDQQILNKLITIGEIEYPLEMMGTCMLESRMYQSIPGSSYFFAVATKPWGETDNFETITIFENKLELIFPDFIPQFTTEEFKNRLDLFLFHTLPVHLPCKPCFAKSEDIKNLIPAFVNWHNCLLRQIQIPVYNDPQFYAKKLHDQISKIQSYQK